MTAKTIQKAIKLYKRIPKNYEAQMVVSGEGMHILAEGLTVFVEEITELNETLLLREGVIQHLSYVKHADTVFTSSGCTSGNFKSLLSLKTYEGKLYAFDDISTKGLMKMSTSDLKFYLESVAFAVAREDISSILTNICWDEGVMVATDGYRIAQVETDSYNTYGRILIPSVVEKLLSLSLPKKLDTVMLTVLENETSREVVFIADNVWIRYTMPDGEFLNYEKWMAGAENTISFRALKVELENVLTQMTLPKMPCQLTFDPEKSLVSLSHVWEDVILRGDIPVILADTEVDLETFKIYFRPKYLLDALKRTEGDSVTLGMRTPADPITLYGEGVQHLIVPVRTNR